jgi:cell division protein DivIC
MDFNKKQKGEVFKKLFLKAGALIITVVLIILVIANIKIYKKRKSLESEILKYEQQIQQLKDRNKDIENRLENSDNSDYIEKIAREEQDMQKPGESVVAFIMPDQQNKQVPQEDYILSGKWFSWVTDFWNYILDIFK